MRKSPNHQKAIPKRQSVQFHQPKSGHLSNNIMKKYESFLKSQCFQNKVMEKLPFSKFV